ncbi:MAG: polyketide synthase dehydratase domain-containing protein, partial [Myxococcales bacterium]|nr:polyketide synthase dehydratase domain-containing protein [Myxococcales bacterium]
SVQLAAETWIGDHRVGEIALVPGAAYLVWARRAVTGHGDAIEVCDLSIEAALPLAEDEHAELQAVCHFVEPGVWDAELLSSKGGSWIRHARARVIVAGGESGEAPTSVASLAEARGRCREPLSGEALYQNLANAGLRYGPAFRGLTELWLGAGEAVAELPTTEEVGRSRGLHPAWVDAAQHAVAPLLPAGRWLPIAVKSLRVFSPIPERAFVHARLRVQDAELPTAREVEADFVVYTDEGAPVATLRGLRLHLVEAAVSRRDELRLFEDSWVQAPLATQSRPPVRERWLIFGDDHELSASLAEALRGHPHASVDFLRSLSPASAEQIAGAAVIVLGGGRPESLWKPLQHILRAEAEPSRVSILTRGAWAPREIKDSAVPDPLARAAWGLRRTLRHEQPAWDLLLIDVEARNWAASLSAAAAALVNLDDERELLFYRGDRWVGRWRGLPTPASPPQRFADAQGRAFRLGTGEAGDLASLALREVERVDPGPGEIEIAIEAAGVSFSDVLKAHGLYPGADGPPPLGVECSGRVARIGPEVDGWAEGDAVVAILDGGGFGSHAIARASLVAPRPPRLSPTAAATLPGAFLTAYHSLVTLAQLQPGERVLIHSASGGVGQAALQIALDAGAEVYGTAGTREKRG